MKYTDRYRNTPRTNFSYFNEGVGDGTGQWALTTTGTPGTAVDDTTNYIKTKAIQVTTASGGTPDTVKITKTLDTPINIYNFNSARIKILFTDQVSIDGFQRIALYFLTDDSNYAGTIGFSMLTPTGRFSHVVGRWGYIDYSLRLVLTASGAQKVGNPDFTNITKIRVSLFGLNTYVCSVTLAQLDLIPFESLSKMVVQFSGARSSLIDYAKPKMDALSLKGTVFINKNLVDTVGYATLSQLLQLQSSGWTIANAGATGNDMSTMTEEEIRTEINDNITYMDSNGFTASRLLGLRVKPSANYQLIYDTIKSCVDFCQYLTTYFTPSILPLSFGDIHGVPSTFAGTSVTELNLKFATWVGDNLYDRSCALVVFNDLTTGTPTGTQWAVTDFNNFMDDIREQVDLGHLEDMTLEEFLDRTLTYFSTDVVSDNTSITSSLEGQAIVNLIQDPIYFPDSSSIDKVTVYYKHQDGRQEKKLILRSPEFSTPVEFSEFTLDGTWSKHMIVVGKEGPVHELTGSDMSHIEDFVHIDGKTYLNS